MRAHFEVTLPPIILYLVKKRLLDDGVVPVDADRAQVQDRHRAEGHVEGVVCLVLNSARVNKVLLKKLFRLF